MMMMMVMMMRMMMTVFYACDIIVGACLRTGGRGTSATCPPVVDAVGVVIFHV